MKVVVVSLALLCMGSASAYTLDFGNAPSPPSICSTQTSGLGSLVPCGANASINQAYGDVAGVVDVVYTNVTGQGNSLLWFDNNYNNLYGVLYASGGDATSRGRISLVPEAGQMVTLQGFALGAFNQATRSTNVEVFAIGNAVPVYTFSGPVGNSNVSATPFSVNLNSSTGFHIEWFNSAFNVAIDNVNFSVTPIPEPGTWALMAGGLMAVAGWARRRR